MKNTRRNFLKSSAVAAAGSGLLLGACQSNPGQAKASRSLGLQVDEYAKLDEALKRPVLKRELFPDPVIIESCDLLHYDGDYIVRVRSKDGAVGIWAASGSP